MHTQIHMHIYTHRHPHTEYTGTYTQIHTQTRTDIHTWAHTHRHTPTHTDTLIATHMQIYTHTQAHPDTQTHTTPRNRKASGQQQDNQERLGTPPPTHTHTYTHPITHSCYRYETLWLFCKDEKMEGHSSSLLKEDKTGSFRNSWTWRNECRQWLAGKTFFPFLYKQLPVSHGGTSLSTQNY